MVEYVYATEIAKKIENKEFVYEGDSLDTVKGLNLSNGMIYINLSARQWKGISDDSIIQEMSKTIVHETLHTVVGQDQEYLCQLMAGQVPEITFG